MNAQRIIHRLHNIMDICDIHTVDNYQYPIISKSIVDALIQANNKPVLINITNENYWTLFKVHNISTIESEYNINNHPILLIFDK